MGEELLARLVLALVVVLRLEVEVVHLLLLLPELGGGHVHADLNLAGVARHLDGLNDEVETLLVLEDVRGEAALVAHVARVLAVLLGDNLLQVVVDLRAHLHRLLEGGRANRQDHELLHGELVAGVAAAVNNVERRHRHVELVGRVTRELGNVLVERHALGRGAGLADRHRDGENGIGAELGLGPAPVILGAVELLHHLVVNLLLLRGVHADERWANNRVDVLDSLAYALAHVISLDAIAKLEGLIDAS
mmetsp:Transcript_39290/g.86371  ORF Transcript_39290/g.86371 Transcript_39290/m.86371 type:complete len:249 (+) Transcript_39290:676-1422(+)